MTLTAPPPPRTVPEPRTRAPVRAGLILAVVLAVVVWADQTSKGWAWRHLSDVHLNAGGNSLTGAHLSGWLRDPWRGALLDVLDTVLLAGAGVLVVRARRGAAVTVCAALAVAGWTSNLLDRLGLHYLTAPGSVRGAVDFLPWGGHYWNVADLTIIAGSTGLVLALTVEFARTAGRPRPAVRRRTERRRRAPVVAAAGVALTGIAVLAVWGALHDTGLDAPTPVLGWLGRS